MTDRITPTLPNGEIPEPSDVVALLALTDPSDVVALVREWTPSRRQSAILAVVAADPTRADLLGAITTAPFGPDPMVALRAEIERRAESLAALVLAVDSEPSDVVALLSAALTRVSPETPETIAEITAPPSRTRGNGAPRVRRAATRVFTPGVSGDYRTPGRAADGIAPGVLTVRVSHGVPSYVTSDGATFPNATRALRHEDQWGDARGGWGNPFDVCTRIGGSRAGDTLGELAQTEYREVIA